MLKKINDIMTRLSFKYEWNQWIYYQFVFQIRISENQVK